MNRTETILFRNATLVNEGRQWQSDLLVKGGRIERIDRDISTKENAREIDATGNILMPGVIDVHVHFREPGLTHKAEIATESMAAVAGGTTSYMEMPNTKPPVLSREILEDKYLRASQASVANYSFYMGVSNDNTEEVLRVNDQKKQVCGLKIYMGSSTGNMLVDDEHTLARIFANSEVLIATHCESEAVINANKEKYAPVSHVSQHPVIRDVEACYESTVLTMALAQKYNSRLHIAHVTTARETELFNNSLPLSEKRITAEVCTHHLHFTADDYQRLGTQIQCNPAIKEGSNKEGLWQALLSGKIDLIATDHAPHTWEEKQQPYPASPSGLPLVQHSLYMMLHYVQEGRITLERMVEKMCHAPALCYRINERGFLREGYFADLVLLNPKGRYTVSKQNILYKCGWSPLEGMTFPASVEKTLVNGQIAYENGLVIDTARGQRLTFNR
ncbi:MAG TPA: dihydroorotase [Edaphocola sp.]|nr:dihydroorotase [Edaphocola sp.]